MAKKRTLLDELDDSEPVESAGNRTWHKRLTAKNPILMEEMNDVIDRFLANDPRVLSKRQSKTSLADFLSPVAGVKRSAIVRYIDERANESKR